MADPDRPSSRNHFRLSAAPLSSITPILIVRRWRAFLGTVGIIFALSLAATASSAAIPNPEGVWLMDNEVALQVYNCSGRLCGRVVWMLRPRNKDGEPNTDKKNPNPALRQRKLCGTTVLKNLRPDGEGRWKGGTFYNPRDGKSYKVRAQLTAPDELVARIYRIVPLLGTNKALHRVPHLSSDGWC
jgi:uncharacterized protein (DUF2147 family)